jgi:hypothetical protein
VRPEANARAAELRERRRAKRRASRNRAAIAVAILLAFGIGIALGQALHDNPQPGGQQTILHTSPPLTATTTPEPRG